MQFESANSIIYSDTKDDLYVCQKTIEKIEDNTEIFNGDEFAWNEFVNDLTVLVDGLGHKNNNISYLSSQFDTEEFAKIHALYIDFRWILGKS